MPPDTSTIAALADPVAVLAVHRSAEALGDGAREVVVADRILEWRSPAHLAEALETSAAVAPIEDEQARAALAREDGVAALLCW